MIITLDEMKTYLRVDYSEDDALIESMISSAQQLCMDVARIEDAEKFIELGAHRLGTSRLVKIAKSM